MSLIDADFKTYEDYEKGFIQNKITPDQVKETVIKTLNSRMKFIREAFSTPVLTKLIEKAYPETVQNIDDTSIEDPAFLNKIFNFPTNNTFKEENKQIIMDIFSRFCPPEYKSRLENVIKDCIEKKDPLRFSWSIGAVNMIHSGHLMGISMISHLSHVKGVECIIIVKNLEAILKKKISLPEAKDKGKFFSFVVKSILEKMGANMSNLRIIMETDFQLNSSFMLSFYRLLSLVPEKSAALAAHIDVNIVDPEEDDESSSYGAIKLSRILIPILRMLNNYFSFSWISISKQNLITNQEIFEKEVCNIFNDLLLTSKSFSVFDKKFTPSTYIATYTLPSLQLDQTASISPMTGTIPAMRSLEAQQSANSLQAAQQAEDLTINLFEPVSDLEMNLLPGLKKKIKKAFCEPENIEKNPILDIFVNFTFRMFSDQTSNLIIERSENNGGPLQIGTVDDSLSQKHEQLLTQYREGNLHPGDLKSNLADMILKHVGSLVEGIPKEELASHLNAAFPKINKKSKKPNTNTNNEKKAKAVCENTIDIYDRVHFQIGKIVSIEKHPDADKLYVEKVNFGEEDLVTVVSGLAGLYPMENLINRFCIFVTNLKPAKLCGILSQAMLLCASYVDENEKKHVHPLDIPNSVAIDEFLGSRVFFGDVKRRNIDWKTLPPADVKLNPKEKVWESVCERMKVSADHRVLYDNRLTMYCPDGSEVMCSKDLPPGSLVK